MLRFCKVAAVGWVKLILKWNLNGVSFREFSRKVRGGGDAGFLIFGLD